MPSGTECIVDVWVIVAMVLTQQIRLHANSNASSEQPDYPACSITDITI